MSDKQEKTSKPWYSLFRSKIGKNEQPSSTFIRGPISTSLSGFSHRGSNASSQSASAEARSPTTGFAKPSKEIFGVPLPADLNNTPKYAYNPKHFISGIPVVLYKVIEFLMQKGLETEGLFRVSASLTEIQDIKTRFDKGEDVDFFDSKICSSVHVAAAALKLYLRELPEPLITYDLYDCLQKSYATIDNPEERLKRLRSIIYILPNLNYECLGLLVKFLKKVTEYSDVNKMSSANLAICFAPNIIRVENETGVPSTIFDTPNSTLIMKTLIDESDYLFDMDDPASPICSILHFDHGSLPLRKGANSVSAPTTPTLLRSFANMEMDTIDSTTSSISSLTANDSPRGPAAFRLATSDEGHAIPASPLGKKGNHVLPSDDDAHREDAKSSVPK